MHLHFGLFPWPPTERENEVISAHNKELRLSLHGKVQLEAGSALEISISSDTASQLQGNKNITMLCVIAHCLAAVQIGTGMCSCSSATCLKESDPTRDLF